MAAACPGVAPAGSPVAKHGALHVCGTTLCDELCNVVQLAGVSSFWLNYEDEAGFLHAQVDDDQNGRPDSEDKLAWLRDNWGTSVVRASMGVDVEGGYLENPSEADKVIRIVTNAIRAGVYVIIDWHSHHAEQPGITAAAKQFFSQMAGQFGNCPNVLYEPYNEPFDTVSWTSTLKPYHQEIVRVIREKDPDNVALLGTRTWDQAVDDVIGNTVDDVALGGSGQNLAYSLHFYSCSHGVSNRAAADKALAAGVPLFITEFALTHYNGGRDGETAVCAEGTEGELWMDWASGQNASGLPVSWTAWKFDAGPDTSSFFAPGTLLHDDWNAAIKGHAVYLRERMQQTAR